MHVVGALSSSGMADVAPATQLIPRGMQGVLPCLPSMVNVGTHNTIDASEARGGDLPYLSSMGVDGAHNIVG